MFHKIKSIPGLSVMRSAKGCYMLDYHGEHGSFVDYAEGRNLREALEKFGILAWAHHQASKA